MNQTLLTQTINQYFTHLSNKDSEAWIKLFSPEAVSYDPVGNPPSIVHNDYQKFFELLNFYRQSETIPENIFVAGNEAAVKWKMSVTARNGNTANAEGITVFIFNQEGKISETRAYWDDKKFLEQLVLNAFKLGS
jgi:ketosteroid isomerase-like protein